MRPIHRLRVGCRANVLVARASPTGATGRRPEPGDLGGGVLEAAEITKQGGEGGRRDRYQVLAGHPVAISASIFEEITGVTGDVAWRTGHYHRALVGALAGVGEHVGLPSRLGRGAVRGRCERRRSVRNRL